MFDAKSIVKQFQISGEPVDVQPYGSGHIHDTYVVKCRQEKMCLRYILQRINSSIFKNPEAVMENIVRVTTHIRGKLDDAGANDIQRRVLKVVPTQEGRAYFRCPEGNYWRCFNFIENARTYNICRSPEHIYESARAFGEFENYLIDLPGPALHETIPDFHNGPKRFMAFQTALKKNKYNRAKSVKKEIDFLLSNSWIFDVLPKLAKENKIPLRITHNDAKNNNIMFDNTTLKAICVIDLDTVMPGISLYDFGDIVRTTISDAAEDEPDLSKVTIDISRFEAIVKGYLSSAGTFLNKVEVNNLLLGAKIIILEQAVRFLTDLLAGDTYYKINRPDHNLDRTRTQIRLYELILEHEGELNEIVNRIITEL